MVVYAQTATSLAGREAKVAHATGSFEVKLAPQTSDPPLGRFLFDKEFHGGLQGSSKGEMLTGSSGTVFIADTGNNRVEEWP